MKNKFQSGLGRWDGHSIPSQESIAFLEGRKATVELKTVHPHFSRQQWRIFDNGRKLDQAFLWKVFSEKHETLKSEGNMSKLLFVFLQIFVFRETKSLANSVPAAAVRQRGKVLSLWTWSKKQVGGKYSSFSKCVIHQTLKKKEFFWKNEKGNGMVWGRVELEHTDWNIKSEGNFLFISWRWVAEVWRTNEIRYLSSPHRQQWVLYNFWHQKVYQIVEAKCQNTLPGEYCRKAETQKNWLLERLMVEPWGLNENNV